MLIMSNAPGNLCPCPPFSAQALPERGDASAPAAVPGCHVHALPGSHELALAIVCRLLASIGSRTATGGLPATVPATRPKLPDQPGSSCSRQTPKHSDGDGITTAPWPGHSRC